MRKERPEQEQGFSFTENEKLWDRISHERFKALIGDSGTEVHSLELSSNNYGEFLFVTTSRASGEGRSRITFWGLGYHEYRDRWLTNEWFWYEAYPNEERDKKSLDKVDVDKALQERLDEINQEAQSSNQSRRGELFEMFADLADDDGAIAEMEDLQDLWADWDDI